MLHLYLNREGEGMLIIIAISLLKLLIGIISCVFIALTGAWLSTGLCNEGHYLLGLFTYLFMWVALIGCIYFIIII